MRLFIPEIGTVIVLAEDWTFKVINESRNGSLAKLTGKNDGKSGYYYPFGVEQVEEPTDYGFRTKPKDAGYYTWPKGTELEVDRIYIRKGNEDFSSVTFKTRVRGKQVRFFAKLEDVNRIEL